MTNKVTVKTLQKMKSDGEKIAVLTAYDYFFGKVVDEAGVDVALVGDSLGQVVLGYESTLQVTMEDMLRHTGAVSRGVKRAMVVADMPFMSYQASEDKAVRNAGRLLAEAGASAVKLEGGKRTLPLIRRLVDIGIPVMGHVGLTPQSVHQLGGYATQGEDEENAKRIEEEAVGLEDAGVFSLVLEKVPQELAGRITNRLNVPTIGIGAGPLCDGQVLVVHDILGMFDKYMPPFARRYADVGSVVDEAVSRYCKDVKEGDFPQ